MARTIVEVVKVVAPVALQALAQAAAALISGAARSTPSFATLSSEDVGSIIIGDTTQYINLQFQDNYRYFYKGLGSQPPGARTPLIGASEDIIVWNPGANEQADIQTYITNVLKDTLADDDAIEVAKNLTDLFEARFKEIDLSWTPFTKRFNLSSGVTIDLEMVTAAGHDADNNPLGVATFCFAAYSSKST